MMQYFVHGQQIILEDETVEDGYLEIKDGKFGKVLKKRPDHGVVIDYSEMIISPGLVDTHIHGFGGHDVMDGTFDALNNISKELLKYGVTSWLPTTLTSSIENLNYVCQLISESQGLVEGSKIQGIFLEGPFFTETHKGAQNPDYMMDPSIEYLIKWLDLSQGLLKKVAIAPERKGVKEFIECANKNNIVVSLAHSNASFSEVQQAVNEGASIFVHTFNGMSGLHHREPGMVGAALTCKNVFTEIIADGHHVHPMAIKLLLNSRSSDEVILITDCMRAGGMGNCRSKLGEFDVIVENEQARLVDGNSLAGSVLNLPKAIKNLIEWELVDIITAIKMATIVPARSINIQNTCGVIVENNDADYIILDKKGNLKATYINGKKVFESE